VHEKGKGHLTELKEQLGAPQPVVEVEAAQPGGQAAIVLNRDQSPGAVVPEFLSATVLPGRGMNVLQITAFVPGRGAVPLLASPPLAEAAKAMSGAGDDADGQASLTNGAAFEVPWAGRMTGAPLPGGMSVLANWHGRGLTLPLNWTDGSAVGAIGGLLLRRGASAATPSVMPDGGVAQASFAADDFDGHWASKTEVKATVLLSARTIDLTVVARNAGSEPEPMGIGWRPRFAIGGDREQVRLRVPSRMRAETKDGLGGLPTGRLVPVERDFSGPEGSALGPAGLNELYVGLRSGELSDGPVVELRDPAAGYGIRMTALSASIKAVRVVAAAKGNFVEIDPQTNYDDPLGREWGRDVDAGLVVLQPGESLQWKMRLELFPLTGAGPRAGNIP
jgi:hypothetical protein